MFFCGLPDAVIAGICDGDVILKMNGKDVFAASANKMLNAVRVLPFTFTLLEVKGCDKPLNEMNDEDK